MVGVEGIELSGRVSAIRLYRPLRLHTGLYPRGRLQSKIWWERVDSNHRRAALQAAALPAELRSRNSKRQKKSLR
jgi:hypothetical protein